MLTVSTFDTVTGNLIEHLPHDSITGEVLVTLATGSETSTAVLEVSLSKAEVAGWRTRFAKVDRSVALWDNDGGVVTVHYAGFIDKVEADGVADGGIHLTLRLSDAAENLKMIKLSEDRTFEAGTWAGVIRAVIEGAFSQPNTPTVAVVGATAGGTGKKLEVKPTSGGASYSSLIEDVKTTSNGGYAEVAFTPVARSSGGSFTGMSWKAEVGATLINLDNTVDVENHEDVYEFTISTDSNSTYSRLTLMNAEGARKVYTNPNGGTVLSDEVLPVDAALADFDAIAAAYMQSDLLASSESHEVHVKMELATVRGIVGGAGVLPKAVEYNWSTSVRLRIVQAEYRIQPRQWGSGRKTVPVELTFAPITNKTWVPPSRADSDNTNQDWIDKNKYSGVGRDSFSGAHPGDYGGVGGGGGDGPGDGGDPELPSPPMNGIPDSMLDDSWGAGSEPMEFPDLASGRQAPIYAFDVSDVKLYQPIGADLGTSVSFADKANGPRWATANNTTAYGQSIKGGRIWWCWFSSTDPNSQISLGDSGSVNYRRGGTSFPSTTWGSSNNRQPLKFVALSDLTLKIASAKLVEGELEDISVQSIPIDAKTQKQMVVGNFMVGDQADWEFYHNELGLGETDWEAQGNYQGMSNIAPLRIVDTGDRLLVVYRNNLALKPSNSGFWRESNRYRGASVARYMVIPKSSTTDEIEASSIRLAPGGTIKFFDGNDGRGLMGVEENFFWTTFATKTWLGLETYLVGEYNTTPAAKAFNAGAGTFMDYSSINEFPSIPGPQPKLPPHEPSSGSGLSNYRRFDKGNYGFVVVSRSSSGNGESLYIGYDRVNRGREYGLVELELSGRGLAPRSAFAIWKPVKPWGYPDQMTMIAGSGGKKVVAEGVIIAPEIYISGTSTEGTAMASYPGRATPLPEGSSSSTGNSVGWTGSVRRTDWLDGIRFNVADAGFKNYNLDPLYASYPNLIREAYRKVSYPDAWFYHKGYMYSISNSVSVDYVNNSEAGVEGSDSIRPWCASFRIEPRDEKTPLPEESQMAANWWKAWGDVPLNFAARLPTWNPQPRYPEKTWEGETI